MDDEPFEHDALYSEAKDEDLNILNKDEVEKQNTSISSTEEMLEQDPNKASVKKEEQVDDTIKVKEEQDTFQKNQDDQFQEKKKQEKREKVTLENIKLDVRFEMNRIKTSLSELRNYEAGYVFDFTLDPDAIYLTVAGQTIGQGQLVEIGEKVGVRITEIYK